MKLFYLARIDVEEEGASKRHVVEFCKSFASLGHEVTLYVPDLGARPRFEGFNTVYVRAGSRRPAVTFFTFYLALFFIFLKNHISGQRPDVVYTRHQQMEWLVTGLGRPLNFKYVVEINGLSVLELEVQGKPGWIVAVTRLIERFSLRLPDRIVVVTEPLKDHLCRAYKLKEDRFLIASNASDPDVFKPMDQEACRARLDLDAGAKYLVIMCTFKKWHGLDQVVLAMPALIEAVPAARLLLVGDGEERPAIERLIAENNLAGQVILCGMQPHHRLPLYLNAADICLGSFTEKPGLRPLKIFDYMACGKPIIANAVGGLGPFLAACGAGEVLREESPAGWVEAVTGLLGDPGRMRRYGENGRQAVLEEFSWPAIVKKIEAGLRAMLQEK